MNYRKKGMVVMNVKTLSSYIGCIRNPFCNYVIDLDGLGSIEINMGILTTRGYAYDLFPISNAAYTATLAQKLFGLGNVSFTVKDNDEIKKVVIRNIRDAKYITGILRAHHQDMLREGLAESCMVHLI